ncbi:streptococcal histidine triad-family protein [Streptococcus dysgalactiae]|uniref:pneumococcal-type histidine triad protein n=1 Tax=Streptococcus dysgalactiae TaxID=1334 RepID=UPI000D91FC5E|nr:streptococcal histidine triad-family protein [Streptococcus dysgalactiae]VTT13994.1 streptococcal histidine triad-family protein [Streptococcus dysgalactiae subsp. equisimilis]
MKHDGHSHFFFYSDLKGSKWDYLIPKGYKDTSRQETTSAATSKASTTGHHGDAHASDGYVFNPNDIVSEDVNGYTVRHGDHYHYIWKKDLVVTARPTVQQGPQQSPSTNSSSAHHKDNKQSNGSENGNHHDNIGSQHNHVDPLGAYRVNAEGKKEFSGIHYATSDDFLFDGKHIIGNTADGLLVAHNGRKEDVHLVPYAQLVDSKWAHLIPEDKRQQAEKHYHGEADETPKTSEKGQVKILSIRPKTLIQSYNGLF